MVTQARTAVGERVEARLSTMLGPNTARNALRTFSTRTLGIEPGDLTEDDVPRLLAALRPALRTLLGAAAAEGLLEEIQRGFP